MADRTGQQLGNYRLTRLLGQGGFGEVYLGEHMYLKTQAAIKVQSTQLAREEVEDFLAEARTVAHLEHPNIVRVLEFGLEGAVPYLVMSYAPNGSLRQRHPRGQPVPFPLILQYVRQVADALQYAHDQRLIHRDIKPENMLLGRRNEVLLSDFGIAIISQTSRSKSVQEVIGTVTYMSPEMLQGKPKFASDQYSLGIVVYEWLCGERPCRGGFTEVASQHLFVPPPSLRKKNATISANLEQVVMTALAKEPEQRFSSVRAFARALEQAGQSAGYQPTVSAPPPSKPFQPTQPATPPHSPRQPTVPHTKNQFPQPLTDTLTPSQAGPSSMLNTPSSSAGELSRPIKLSSDPSSRSSQPNTAGNLSDKTKPPRQGISRRAVIRGLAAFIGVAAIAGSIALRSNGSTVPVQPLMRSNGSTAPVQPLIWHVQPSSTSTPLRGVVWSGSQFVVVGTNGTILTSTDGSSWSAQNAGTSESLRGVVWSGSQFVVVGTNTILTSTNSSSWSAYQLDTYRDLYGVAWSGSQFVAVGDTGTILTSS
jgi:serine/threonine protein kinase